MTLPQTKRREAVLQALFALEHGEEGKELISLLMGELEISKKNVVEIIEKARAVLSKMPEYDVQIAATAESYALERIGSVERMVLRLAIYEVSTEETPPKVAISEAIRLARKFASPESASFVNAILDRILLPK